MADNLAYREFLYLRGFDKAEFSRYIRRLNTLYEIFDTATENYFDEQTGENVFRVRAQDDIDPITRTPTACFCEARVVIGEMPNAISPVITVSVTHDDLNSDFMIHDCIPVGSTPPELDIYDHMLDLVEKWEDQARNAFTKFGHIGVKKLFDVEDAEYAASELLNAVVHAYIEFAENEVFKVQIEPTQPYAPTRFFQIVDGERFEFLTPETSAAIDELMPHVVHLSFSANQSVMHYWLSPANAVEFDVSAKTLPPEDELRRIVEPLAQIEPPHFLDAPVPVE